MASSSEQITGAILWRPGMTVFIYKSEKCVVIINVFKGVWVTWRIGGLLIPPNYAGKHMASVF